MFIAFLPLWHGTIGRDPAILFVASCVKNPPSHLPIVLGFLSADEARKRNDVATTPSSARHF